MDNIFLPIGFISIGFVILWLMLYPRETFDALCFEDRSFTGMAAQISVWVFFASALYTVVHLAVKAV